MFQIFVLLNFCKVSRRTGEASIEENEIFTRVKGKLSQVINNQRNDDGVEGLFTIKDFEASFNYINGFIEASKRRLLL